MNPGTNIPPLRSAKCLLGRRMSGQLSGQLLGILSLKADELQFGQKNEASERKWQYYNIFIFLERIDILHNERRGQVNTIAMGDFNRILFHKSGPVNKQHTYQLINSENHFYSSVLKAQPNNDLELCSPNLLSKVGQLLY